MDKYEYNVKLEQIKKLIRKKDYATAARIADTIDWYKVKNNQTIVMIADVYEASGRYEQSRENLKLAYDRSGLGRQIAYKLVKICIKCGELEEAEDFYDDFVSAAPRDISKYLLQYELAKAKGDPIDSQISILEQYLEEDMDDKWAFELAKLYHKSGQRDKCIQQCDTVMLWFSDGKYVEKAMDLKMIYTPLSKSQQERYEARWREKSGQPSVNVDEIKVKEVDVANKYNTQNIQDALKESMEELYSGEEKNIFKPSIAEPEYDKASEDFSDAAIYDEAEETASGTDDYIYRMNQSSGIENSLGSDMFSRKDDLGDTKVFVTTRSKKGMGDTKVFAPIRQAMPERISFEEPEVTEEAYILEERTIKNEEAFEEEIEAIPEETFEDEIEAIPEEAFEDEIEAIPEEAFEEEIEPIPEEAFEEEIEPIPEEAFEEKIEAAPEETFEDEIEPIPEEAFEEEIEAAPEEVFEEKTESIPEEVFEKEIDEFSGEPMAEEEAAVSEEQTSESDADAPMSIEDFLYGGGYYTEEEADDVEESEIDIDEPEEDIDEPEDIEEPEIGFEESEIEEEPEDIEESEIEYERPEIGFDEPEEDIEEPEIEYKDSEIWEEQKSEVEDEESKYQEPKVETAEDSEYEYQEPEYEYEELKIEDIEESQYQKPDAELEESEYEYGYEELKPQIIEASESEEMIPEYEYQEPEQEEQIPEYEYQEPEQEEQIPEYEYQAPEQEEQITEYEYQEPEEEQTLEYEYQEPEQEEQTSEYEYQEPELQEDLRNDSESEDDEEEQVLTHDEIKAIIKDFIGKYSGIQGLDKQMLRTLQNIIVDDSCNIFIMGDAKSGKTSLGLDIIKVVNKIKRNNNRRIAKISADKLIGKELSVYFTRLRGSDIYIENISLMDEDTLSELLVAIDKDIDNRIVVIEDEKVNAEKFLERHSQISKYFVNHIVVKQNKIKDWVEVAREYAQEQGYDLDEMGMLALHAKIDQLYAITLVIQKNHVDAVIDNAIKKANKGGLLKKLFGKRKEKILTEEHFN